MANESIRIYYKYLGEFAGRPYYHETILYIDSQGVARVANAGPSNYIPDAGASELISSELARAIGQSTNFGTLATSAGLYIDGVDTDAIFFSNGTERPHIEVVNAPDLSYQWARIVRAEAEIMAAGYAYSGATQNSNSAATTALVAAGLTPPDASGSAAPYMAPGSGNVLETSLTSASSREQFSYDPSLQLATLVVSNYDPSTGQLSDQTRITTTDNGDQTVVHTDSSGNTDMVITIVKDSVTHEKVTDVYTYDSAGNVLSETITKTSADNIVVEQEHIVYDSASGLTTDTVQNFDPNSGQLVDQTVTTTTQSGDQTIVHSDSSGHVDNVTTKTTDPTAGDVTDVWTYDSFGNVASHVHTVSDSSGNTTSSTYDPSGNLTGDTWGHADGSNGTNTFNPDGSSSGSTYYPDGTYSTRTDDGNGTTTARTYDSEDRLVVDNTSYPDGSYSNNSYTYHPDGGWESKSVTGTADGYTHEVDSVMHVDGYQEYGYSDHYADGSFYYQEDIYGPDGFHRAKYGTGTSDGFWYRDDKTWEADGDVTDYWSSSDGSYGEVVNEVTTGHYLTFTHYADGTDSRYTLVTEADGGYDLVNEIRTPEGNLQRQELHQNADGSYDSMFMIMNADGYLYTDEDFYSVDGTMEEKLKYVYSDGSSFWSDHIQYANGSTLDEWHTSDGSFSKVTVDQLAGERHSSGYTAADGTGYTKDEVTTVDGGYEVTTANTGPDGYWYDTYWHSFADGALEASTSDSYGNWTTTSYDASNNKSKRSQYYSDASSGLYVYDDINSPDGSYDHKFWYTGNDGTTVFTEHSYNAVTDQHYAISIINGEVQGQTTTGEVALAAYLSNEYQAGWLGTADDVQLESQVQNLVQAMAAFDPPVAGQTILAQNYAATLSPVIAANSQ